MARLSVSERMRVKALSAQRSRRKAISRLLYAPPLRWRYRSGGPNQLLIIPQDLRTTDPSFWPEYELGQFGLAGTLAILDDRSPFDVTPPSEAWYRNLHGFGWLRHMAAADEPEAQLAARNLTLDWISRYRKSNKWDPAIAARRIISWITHANYLLEDADAKTYAKITNCLGHQIVRLSATWREAPIGKCRLNALIAIVLADLSVAGYEHRLDGAERMLCDELGEQILSDGGHISRNPSILIDLMLDLLPLSQCFVARNRMFPPTLSTAMSRMLVSLRMMRMGDNMLARFNGKGLSSSAGLATVLAYDDRTDTPPPTFAPATGYARLAAGDAILIADIGSPPPLEFAGEAHAGCLSFELSSGRELVFVNGGAPGSADENWRAISRATASHNTLSLGGKSSSNLVHDTQLENLIGSAPIRFPNKVERSVRSEGPGGGQIEASHDGYAHRFNLLHHRSIEMSQDGRRIDGVDKLDSARGSPVRFKEDVPFAIHFHLHPDVEPKLVSGAEGVKLTLISGERWIFTAKGATINLEDSVYFSDAAGARLSTQIVLRGSTFGESKLHWVLVALPNNTG